MRTGTGRDGKRQALQKATKDRKIWRDMIAHDLKGNGMTTNNNNNNDLIPARKYSISDFHQEP